MASGATGIRPTSGKVFLTDHNTRYPDASDHNLVNAHLAIDAATSCVFSTFNVRRYAFDLGTKYDWDVYRDHEAAQVIVESGASVLAVQECEPQQDAYLIKKLPELTGVPWQAVSASTNVGLFYKADRWKLIDTRGASFDNSTEPDRRLVLVLLESVKTGSQVWFASTHLGVHFYQEAIWRRRQAKGICEYLKAVPGYGDIRKKTVIGGDFNDWPQRTSYGVRQIFDEYGFRDHRDRLSDADFDGDTLRTNHGFGKLTVRDGRQIDAIFTSL